MLHGSTSLLMPGVALSLFAAPARANAGDLGESKTSDASVQLAMKGQRTIGGKPYAVELVYGFEENKPSGAFTLTTNR